MAVGVVGFPNTLDDATSLIQTANNSSTLLTAAVSAADTVFPVLDTSSFPASGVFTCEQEIVWYAGKTSTSFAGCERGKEGKTAASHASGVIIEGRVTARQHTVLADAVVAVEQRIGTGTEPLATQPWVTSQIAASTGGVSSFNTRTGAVTLTEADINAAATIDINAWIADLDTRVDTLEASGVSATLPFIDVTAEGLKGDGVCRVDGVSTAASTTFSSAGASFQTTDVGKAILIELASGAYHSTTIAGRVSATSVTLAAPTPTSGPGLRFYYGTDDAPAAQAMFDAHVSPYGASYVFSPGRIFLFGSTVTVRRTGNGTWQTWNPIHISGYGAMIKTYVQNGSVFYLPLTNYGQLTQEGVFQGAIFEGLTIEGTDLPTQTGINIVASYRSVIRDCTILIVGTGIDLAFNIKSRVSNVVCDGVSTYGVMMRSSVGLHTDQPATGDVTNCTVCDGVTVVYRAPSALAAFALIDTDQCELLDCVIESHAFASGACPCDVLIDNTAKSASHTAHNLVRNLYTENTTPTEAVFRIKGKGAQVTIQGLRRLYRDTTSALVDATGALDSTIVFKGLNATPTPPAALGSLIKFKQDAGNTCSWLFESLGSITRQESYRVTNPQNWVGGVVPARISQIEPEFWQSDALRLGIPLTRTGSLELASQLSAQTIKLQAPAEPAQNFTVRLPANYTAGDTLTVESVTGGVVQLKAGVYVPPWAPTQITGLAVWYDAQNIGAGLANNSPVSQWNDQSGAARHLTATATDRPNYQSANLPGGLPSVSFSNLEFMQTPPILRSALTGTSECHIFLIAWIVSTDTAQTQFAWDSSGAGTQAVKMAFNNAGAWYFIHSDGSAAGGTISDAVGPAYYDALNIFECRRSGLQGNIYVNQTQVPLMLNNNMTSNFTTDNSAPLYVGGDSASSRATMAMAELLIYNHALTTLDRTTLYNYLKTKWGISYALSKPGPDTGPEIEPYRGQ